MAKNSHIEWTHHTFNPWWGCEKVSPACAHCYAEAWAKRVGEAVWGRRAPRRFFSDDHWKDPLRWHADAVAAGVRARVFCASMADVFEDRRDLDAPRLRLWELIADTPMLDWLLLTKRPEVVRKLAPWARRWPENVWLGTTVESQEYADQRIPHLLKNAARIRFLSCEPLLGEIDLSRWLNRSRARPLHWVIAGGESGVHSRPMHPEWARKLRDQADAHGVAFHFKQWGHWAPAELLREDERRRKAIAVAGRSTAAMVPLGKKDAGRLLDGVTHDGFPSIPA